MRDGTSRDRFPLTRRVGVERLPQGRGSVVVEASPEECAALAADFGIPAIRDLAGRFALAGSTDRLTVTGTVEAVVTQVCTVTLEPFEAPVREPVEVVFSDAGQGYGQGQGHAFGQTAGDDEADPEAELPDPIVDGRIDFGALTAEFLALGLDPYPRKPGARFEPAPAGPGSGPFDALRRLREGEA